MSSSAPASRKSSVTSLPVFTPRKGPKATGSGSPRISARNVADSRLSRAWTIVWLSLTAIPAVLSLNSVRREAMPSSRLRALFAALSLCAAQALAQSASYPSKPVRLVIAAAPGGSTDVLGRLLAQRLGERFGQPFVPENRGGAGGVVAA